MRHAVRLFLMLCLAAPFAVSVSAQQPAAETVAEEAADPVAPLVGSWSIVGSGGATERRDAAVETAIDDMGPLIRAIARGRLKDGMPIPRRVQISQSGDSVRVRVGQYETNMAIGSPATSFQNPLDEDSVMRATHRHRNGWLVQRFVGDGGTLTHSIRMRGNQLVVRVKVSSPRLPADAVYWVRYRRQ